MSCQHQGQLNLIWGEITGIEAPTVVVPADGETGGTTAPDTRTITQANAALYEMLVAAVDDIEFTAIVADEEALGYKAVDLLYNSTSSTSNEQQYTNYSYGVWMDLTSA